MEQVVRAVAAVMVLGRLAKVRELETRTRTATLVLR